MRVLIACERSQNVCMAFRNRGHEAFSCDIEDCLGDYPEFHIKDDVLNQLNNDWDLMIGHPPCTYTAFSGTAHWNKPGRVFKRLEALTFMAKLWTAPIDKICLEQPKSCASPVITKYNQEIQPYYFGDSHIKTTWLWLKNLPLLEYRLKDDLFGIQTSVDKPDPIYIDNTERKKKRYFTDALSSKNKVERSITFKGVAEAMATQWG